MTDSTENPATEEATAPSQSEPQPRLDVPGLASPTADHPPPSGGSTGQEHSFDNRNLRYIFVAFLFSATMARLGETAIVATHSPWWWPTISHLVLTFFVIALSWVGWAGGIATGKQLTTPFSLQFITLISDLVLVVLYLALVKYIEILPPSPPRGDILTTAQETSAVPESTILAIIYGIYLIWDLIHDIGERLWNHQGDRPTLGSIMVAGLVRSGASLLCFGIASLIALSAYKREVHSPAGVVILNAAELGNAVLFRAAKAYESDSLVHVAFRENRDRYGEKRTMMKCVAISMFVAVTILVATSYGYQ